MNETNTHSPKISLRMDDIGASTKKYEVYSKKWFGLGNILFLKYLPYFKAWGPYRELTSDEWHEIITLLEKHDAKLTVGVTACWVHSDCSMTPFPEMFPEEASVLKYGVNRGVIEIANHGLTHCVYEDQQHLPRYFRSNRKYHREFWNWLPDERHHRHIQKAQEILECYFNCEICTLVPPGNVFSDITINAAREHGITVINCNTQDRNVDGIKIISNSNVLAFHDKEIVEFGVSWLKNLLEQNAHKTFCFVREQ